MGKVTTSLTMSLDGFIAGPNDGPEHPLGEGGMRLFDWYSSGDTEFLMPSGAFTSRVSAASAAMMTALHQWRLRPDCVRKTIILVLRTHSTYSGRQTAELQKRIPTTEDASTAAFHRKLVNQLRTARLRRNPFGNPRRFWVCRKLVTIR